MGSGLELVVRGTKIFLEMPTERRNIGFLIQDRLDAAAPFLVTMMPSGQVNVFGEGAAYRYREETGWEAI